MRTLRSLWKPQYLFRPWQVGLRIWRALAPPSDPVQEVVLPWGVPIQINTKEAIGCTIWCAGLYDVSLCEALWRIMPEGGTAVDAGANIGQMTGLLALKAGASGKVLSFEPHPAIFERLSHNIGLVSKRRGTAAVTAHQLALSDTDGEALLAFDTTFAGNEGIARIVGELAGRQPEGVKVPKQRLDVFVGNETVSVLKIDVEGHEPAVFKGAAEALKAGRIRNILYENLDEAGTGVPALLQEYGFSIFGLGYTIGGPLLTRMDEPLRNDPSHDAPNYIATLEPQRIIDLFSPSGWSIFKARRELRKS